MEPIVASYVVTAADVRRSTFGMVRSSLGLAWYFLLVFYVSQVAGLAYGLITGAFLESKSFWSFFTPVFIFLPLLLLLAAKRAFDNTQEFQRHVRLEISDTNIHIADQKQTTSLDWASYSSAKSGFGTIFLITKSGQRLGLPLRVFTDGQRAQLDEILRKRLGAAPSDKRSSKLALVFWVLLTLMFIASIYNTMNVPLSPR